MVRIVRGIGAGLVAAGALLALLGIYIQGWAVDLEDVLHPRG